MDVVDLAQARQRAMGHHVKAQPVRRASAPSFSGPPGTSGIARSPGSSGTPQCAAPAQECRAFGGTQGGEPSGDGIDEVALQQIPQRRRRTAVGNMSTESFDERHMTGDTTAS
jgi:hypothetical protein